MQRSDFMQAWHWQWPFLGSRCLADLKNNDTLDEGVYQSNLEGYLICMNSVLSYLKWVLINLCSECKISKIEIVIVG